MNGEEDPVSQDHQKIVAMAAIGIVGFLIIISVYGVWTDPNPREHPDPWYVYIERFQTLIGGLAAVGAAFITIQQMRKSDERADKRHEDLMRLQLKGEVEAVKLLFNRFYGRLIPIRAFIDFWQEQVDITMPPTTPEGFEPFDAIHAALERELHLFADLLAEDEWRSNDKLLNAEIKTVRQEAIDGIASLSQAFQVFGELRLEVQWGELEKYKSRFVTRTLATTVDHLEECIETLMTEISAANDF